MDRYPFLGSWNFLPLSTLPLVCLGLHAGGSVAGAGQAQTIRFDSLPILTAGGPEITPRLEASSLLGVSLSSSDTNVVTYTEGRLQAKKPGWARLVARQNGNGQFDPAPEVSQLVWVANRPRTLTAWGEWDPVETDKSLIFPDSLRSGVVQISAKGATIAGIRSGDQVFVHSGKSILERMSTLRIPNIARVTVSCGGNSVAAIRKDGSVVDFGGHRYGYPAGVNLVPDSLNHGIVDLQIHGGYSIALREDGSTFGIDNRTRRAWPTPAVVRPGVVAMELSCTDVDNESEFGFLYPDGSLISWNRDSGLTRMPDSMKTNIRAISGGWRFFGVVDRNGRVMEWGHNAHRLDFETPPAAKLSSGVVSLSVDGDYALALKQDGSVVTWGYYGVYQRPPDSVVGGSTDVVANEFCGFAALGKLKPRLSFSAPAKVNWGDGDIEAGLALQPGRIPVFQSSNGGVAEFKEGRILIKHVGTTTLSVSYAADSLWLGAGPVTQILSVQPRRIVIEASKASKVFGESDPVLEYSCAKCGPQDKLTGALSRDTGESVGVYLLQQGSLAASSDHDLVFLSEAFTIEPRKVTIIADTLQKLAGAPDPALTFQVTGLRSGDKLEGSLERDQGEDPGVYPIHQGSLDAGENYTIEFRGANLQIAKTSGLARKAAPSALGPDARARLRHPFVDRTTVFQFPRGLAPLGANGRLNSVLEVRMEGPGAVEVAIFDNLGVPVRSWSGEISQADWLQLPRDDRGQRRLALGWDLRSQAGVVVPEGVYLCKVAVRANSGARWEEVLRIGVR